MSSPGRASQDQAHVALTGAGASPAAPRESHVGQCYLHLILLARWPGLHTAQKHAAGLEGGATLNWMQ